MPAEAFLSTRALAAVEAKVGACEIGAWNFLGHWEFGLGHYFVVIPFAFVVMAPAPWHAPYTM